MSVLHNMMASRLLLLFLCRHHAPGAFPMPAIIVENPLAVNYRAHLAGLRARETEQLRRRLVRCISPVQKVKLAVCHEFGVTDEDLNGASKARKHLIPRQVAMYLARRYTTKMESHVARAFNKDETCVRVARIKMPGRIAANAMLAQRVASVEALLVA